MELSKCDRVIVADGEPLRAAPGIRTEWKTALVTVLPSSRRRNYGPPVAASSTDIYEAVVALSRSIAGRRDLESLLSGVGESLRRVVSFDCKVWLAGYAAPFTGSPRAFADCRGLCDSPCLSLSAWNRIFIATIAAVTATPTRAWSRA